MLIKVSRGTRALARFRIARPADTLFNNLINLRVPRLSIINFEVSVGSDFISRMSIYSYIRLMIWMSDLVLSSNNGIFSFIDIKLSLFASSQDWISFRSLFSFLCRSV